MTLEYCLIFTQSLYYLCLLIFFPFDLLLFISNIFWMRKLKIIWFLSSEQLNSKFNGLIRWVEFICRRKRLTLFTQNSIILKCEKTNLILASRPLRGTLFTQYGLQRFPPLKISEPPGEQENKCSLQNFHVWFVHFPSSFLQEFKYTSAFCFSNSERVIEFLTSIRRSFHANHTIINYS